MNTEPKRLYRSRTNRMVGGVCAGIADYLNMDPTVVRLLFLLLTFATGGTALILYIAMLFVVPEDPAGPRSPAAPVSPEAPSAPSDDDIIPPPAM